MLPLACGKTQESCCNSRRNKPLPGRVQDGHLSLTANLDVVLCSHNFVVTCSVLGEACRVHSRLERLCLTQGEHNVGLREHAEGRHGPCYVPVEGSADEVASPAGCDEMTGGGGKGVRVSSGYSPSDGG